VKPATLRRSKKLCVLCALNFAYFAFCLVFLTATAKAQGCTQCLDSTQATPPAVQAAYRHAIFLLGGAALTVFVGGLALLRRQP
jgi:hypothetical protein